MSCRISQCRDGVLIGHALAVYRSLTPATECGAGDSGPAAEPFRLAGSFVDVQA
jgi:hypothetical protein